MLLVTIESYINALPVTVLVTEFSCYLLGPTVSTTTTAAQYTTSTSDIPPPGSVATTQPATTTLLPPSTTIISPDNPSVTTTAALDTASSTANSSLDRSTDTEPQTTDSHPETTTTEGSGNRDKLIAIVVPSALGGALLIALVLAAVCLLRSHKKHMTPLNRGGSPISSVDRRAHNSSEHYSSYENPELEMYTYRNAGNLKYNPLYKETDQPPTKRKAHYTSKHVTGMERYLGPEELNRKRGANNSHSHRARRNTHSPRNIEQTRSMYGWYARQHTSPYTRTPGPAMNPSRRNHYSQTAQRYNMEDWYYRGPQPNYPRY